MKKEITIKKVEIIDGKRFEGTTWKNEMQVIYTNEGLFVDNVEGKCFKRPNRSSISWKGINWKQYIRKTIQIIIVDCAGKTKTSYNYKLPTDINGLTRELDHHPRKCRAHAELAHLGLSL